MNECDTAVILAAGLGTRMRRETLDARLSAAQAAAAAIGAKGMIPDARGRPFLDHVLSSLADAGITDVCLVIRPEHHVIREHYRLRPPQRVQVDFVEQAGARGTADAMLRAESWVAGRDVLVLNADNLYPVPAIAALVDLGAPGLVAFERAALLRESNIDPARIAAFALLDIGPDDTLAGIVEKPDLATIDPGDAEWISMNLWRFDQGIFAPCRDVTPSPRGELELPLAVGLAVRRGARFRVVRMAAGVLDLSRRDDIGAMAEQLGDRDIQP